MQYNVFVTLYAQQNTSKSFVVQYPREDALRAAIAFIQSKDVFSVDVRREDNVPVVTYYPAFHVS